MIRDPIEFYFPCYTPKEVDRKTIKRWDFSRRFPLPRFVATCGSCFIHRLIEWLQDGVIKFIFQIIHLDLSEISDVQIGRFRFHTRHPEDGDGHPYRCDVFMKCTDCGSTWTHGVAVPANYWPSDGKINGKSAFDFREALAIMEKIPED